MISVVPSGLCGFVRFWLVGCCAMLSCVAFVLLVVVWVVCIGVGVGLMVVACLMVWGWVFL